MVRVELWFDQDMNQPIKMRALTGSTFSRDSQGTLIGIRCYKNGSEFSPTGSVTGHFVLPNGESFSNVSGNRSGNEVSIRIPQSALLISGQLYIFIKLSDGNVINTIGAFTATVVTTQTGTVITPSSTVVQDWSDEIADALQEFQDGLDDMRTDIAPAYSTTSTYEKGYIVSYNDNFYKANQDINPADGEWNSDHWTLTKLTRNYFDQFKNIRTDIAPAYSSSSTYAKDAIVYYDGEFYKAKQDISTAEEWDSSHWTVIKISTELSKRIDDETAARETADADLRDDIASAYNSESTYTKGDIVSRSGNFYVASQDISTPEEWNAGHWTQRRVSKILTDRIAAEEAARASADAAETAAREDLRDDIAPLYSSANTYSTGAIVSYNGNFYRALQDISTPEAWNPDHWQQRRVSTILIDRISAEETARAAADTAEATARAEADTAEALARAAEDTKINAAITELDSFVFMKRKIVWNTSSSYPTGWSSGYFTKGVGEVYGSANSNNYAKAITLVTEDMLGGAPYKLEFTPPTGYSIEIKVINASTNVITAVYGSRTSDVNKTFTIPHTRGRSYAVNLGQFSGDAATKAADSSFINSIKAYVITPATLGAFMIDENEPWEE